MRGRDAAQRASAVLVVALGMNLLASACERIAPPQLVRDGAGLFTEEARADAESRLRAAATEHGVWAFVITEPAGDPPRMLDAPMGEADAQGVRAVAVLLDEDSMVGGGFSRASFDHGDSLGLSPPDIDELLAAGEADAALDRIVDYLVTWTGSPPPAEQPPPGGHEVGPSG